MNRKVYLETFDNGPGGWMGWMAGGGGPRKLEIINGAAKSQPPWGIDYNHGPPGAGYLHLLYCLMTGEEVHPDFGGANRFVAGGYSTNFGNAKFSVRLRGQMDLKGTELLLLVQTGIPRKKPRVVPNMVLKAQPLAITPDWSEQTLHLVPEEDQWLCMGTRGEGAMSELYGCAPIKEVLKDVNVNLILVLFGLDVVPAQPIQGDPYRLLAGKDYAVDQSRLPRGFVLLDSVRIEYP